MLVQLFISGMNSALTPWMYSKIKKGDIRSMRKVLQLLSIVVVGIAGGADADQPGAGADFRITEVPRGGVRHSAGGSECVLYLHL